MTLSLDLYFPLCDRWGSTQKDLILFIVDQEKVVAYKITKKLDYFTAFSQPLLIILKIETSHLRLQYMFEEIDVLCFFWIINNSIQWVILLERTNSSLL